MKRTLLLSNVLLTLLIAGSIWFIHHRNVEAQAEEARFLNAKVQPPTVLIFATKTPPPVGAQAYVDNTVQKFVFSRDRNPNVIVKPTAPPPEPPMPPLPALYGVFMVGDHPTIFLGIGNQPQRGYEAGARVGDFTLVGFDSKSVTFDWNRKEIKRSLEELAQNQVATPEAQAAPAQVAMAKAPPKVDPDATSRACEAGDNSPAGTISPDGFRKVVIRTPMGSTCHWAK
ncbi:MAG: hypothetical protein WA324_04900 [Bryobacteraceae bacterium]